MFVCMAHAKEDGTKIDWGKERATISRLSIDTRNLICDKEFCKIEMRKKTFEFRLLIFLAIIESFLKHKKKFSN